MHIYVRMYMLIYMYVDKAVLVCYLNGRHGPKSANDRNEQAKSHHDVDLSCWLWLSDPQAQATASTGYRCLHRLVQRQPL